MTVNFNSQVSASFQFQLMNLLRYWIYCRFIYIGRITIVAVLKIDKLKILQYFQNVVKGLAILGIFRKAYESSA